MESGESCGYAGEPIGEDVMIKIFENQPDWRRYGLNTQRTTNARDLFGKSDKFPTGSIIGPIIYNLTQLNTNMQEQIWNSNYEELLYIKGI